MENSIFNTAVPGDFFVYSDKKNTTRIYFFYLKQVSYKRRKIFILGDTRDGEVGIFEFPESILLFDSGFTKKL